MNEKQLQMLETKEQALAEKEEMLDKQRQI